jgi:aminotransferase in exopolysaccharide biosynthesis
VQTDKLIKSIRDIFQTEEFIPLHEPNLGAREEQLVADCLRSTFVSSVGEYVNRVEDQLAELTGTAKATAVVNGTAALQVALRLAGVKAGDEVITQALTFVATANAIAYNSAEAVFIDVDLDTMGLSPLAMEKWLEENAEMREGSAFNKKTNRRIAACMPMHTFGFICRITEIVAIGDKWNIPVVEDAAEALGSYTAEGKSAGSYGLMGAVSFNGNKIITAGGGGAIVSRQAEWAERAKYLTTTAKKPHPYEYFHDELGYNYRMPNLNAALLSAQLERVGEFIHLKKKLFSQYQDLFGTDFNLVSPPKGQQWNHWLISIKTEDKKERDLLLEKTNAAGIMTRPIWQLMYRLPMYASCQKDEQVNAEYLEERIINIPSSAK